MRLNTLKSTQHCRQPRRHKLALLTFIGLIAPLYLVPPAVAALFDGPRWLIVSAEIAGIVALMTYIIMPVLTMLAADWLFEKPDEKSLKA